MRFRVPQFIEIEDRIFGPLTFKQFIYVTGGGSLIVLCFIFLPGFIAIILAIPIGALSASLAFYRFNKRPFVLTIEAAVKYFLRNKLYVWKKDDNRGFVSESFLSTEENNTDSKTLKEKTFALGLNKETGITYETQDDEKQGSEEVTN